MKADYDLMLDSVVTFVSQTPGINKARLTENTLIEEHLGITGLDRVTFYQEFFRRFAIDNSDNFNADE